MQDMSKAVARVRRRMAWVRFVDHVQWTAAGAGGLLLVVAAAARLFGYEAPLLPIAVGAFCLALLAAAVATAASPVSGARAASEVDRILDSRERISTALAVKEGRADDPYGFGPLVASEASAAARRATVGRIAKAIPPRFRAGSLLTLAFAAALLLVPLLPTPASADPSADPAAAKEVKKVAESLRALERRARRKQTEASRKQQEHLKELAERIRKEAARLRGERPKRNKAMARLSQLEREAKNAARRFAGLKPVEAERAGIDKKDLDDLTEALRAFEKADLKATRRQLSGLWDKIRKDELGEMSPAEAASLGRQVSELNRALDRLAAAAGENSELAKMLAGMAGNENMQKLAKALEKLREALGGPEGQKPDAGQLREAMRNYRALQMSDEEIEQLLKAVEELMKMIEAGEEISFCRGDMSGLIGLGLGLGGPGSMPGAGQGGHGSLQGAGGGNGSGPGTGGAGRGRGGDPGSTKNAAGTRPDLVPGRVSEEGDATLIRTIRSLPDPDEDPQEYRRLLREASLEAEEAIRRGDIPRRYRGYVRRFFGGSGNE